MKQKSLSVYIIGVAVAALGCTVALPSTGIRDRLVTLVTLVVLAALSGSRSVRMPRLGIQVTPSDAFMFCALAAVGPLAAPIVALAGTIGALVGSDKPAATSRIAFNLGAVTLSAAAAAWAFIGLQAAGLLAATAAFFLVNTLLVAVAIFMTKKQGFFAIWRQSGLWTFVSSLTSMMLGLGLVALMSALGPLGPLGLLLGLAGSAALVASFRNHKAVHAS